MNAIMNLLPSHSEKKRATLPQQMAAQLEHLRRERLRAYAEQPFHTGSLEQRSHLEQGVDDLLDMLHITHRLEELARQEVMGEPITVEADRVLIANHSETYLELCSRYAAEIGGSTPVSLLPGTAVPLENAQAA